MKEIHAVIYTDGSAGPTNPGPWGGGAHGYLYDNNDLKAKHADLPTGYVMTNIGYVIKENLKNSGGTLVKPLFYINASYSFQSIGTNNTGELEGVIKTLEYLELTTLDEVIGIKNILFKIDSTYVLGVIKSIMQDKTRGWYRHDRVNLEYWIALEKLLITFNNKGVVIETMKVGAHSDNLGNNIADRMAFVGKERSGKNIGKHTFDIRKGNKYWKGKKTLHPFLRYKQLFFTDEQRQFEKVRSYSILDYKGDDEVGIRTKEACFGVVLPSEPPIEIENVIDLFQSNLKRTSIVSTVILKNLYSQPVDLYYTNLFGTDAMFFDKQKVILNCLKETDVVVAIKPPGLAKQAIDKTYELLEVLRVKEADGKDGEYRTYHDITKNIFGVDVKGKPKTLLGVTDKIMEIDIIVSGKDINVKVELGKDCIDRNQFKKIENDEPEVVMIVDKISERLLRYYIYINCKNTNDRGIWCSMYTNNIYL